MDTAYFVSAVNEVLNGDVYVADPTFFWGASLRDREYCADYGGAFKALSRLHVTFAVVPIQSITEQDEEHLRSFKLLVAPSLDHLADVHSEMLARYVAGGGHLLLTGPAPGHLDQRGTPNRAVTA